VQSQIRFNRICGHFIHENPAEVFPGLGFAARFRKICKNKTLRLLGIPPKLIFKMTIPIIRSAEDVFATSLLRFCRLIRLVRIVKVFRLKAMKDWAVD
jgi:hypothetical protein